MDEVRKNMKSPEPVVVRAPGPGLFNDAGVVPIGIRASFTDAGRLLAGPSCYKVKAKE